MKEKERAALQASIAELKERMQQKKSEEQVRKAAMCVQADCLWQYERVVCVCIPSLIAPMQRTVEPTWMAVGRMWRRRGGTTPSSNCRGMSSPMRGSQ